MRLLTQTISKTLHPAYRVQNVERGKLERFKTELARLLEHLGHSAAESEEHLKNIVSDFLKAAFYREEHFVNTKDRQDLVIHNGRTAKDSVGVIIETKKPGNKSEMISPEKPNAKALHELLRYYLNERNLADNKEIRHLIITDINVWYLFDAADFERHIYANNKLLKQYAASSACIPSICPPEHSKGPTLGQSSLDVDRSRSGRQLTLSPRFV